jgi:hypothetical protein
MKYEFRGKRCLVTGTSGFIGPNGSDLVSSNPLSLPNKNKGEGGDISNDKKHHDQNNGERDNASEDLMRRRIGNSTDDEQIDPNGRSTDGDLHGDHEYDRKVNFIDPQVSQNGSN